jgi:hypothetical protein
MLHVDRPCQVCHIAGGGWMWRCLCSPTAMEYTGSAPTWSAAYADADEHMRSAHPKAAVTAGADASAPSHRERQGRPAAPGRLERSARGGLRAPESPVLVGV